MQVTKSNGSKQEFDISKILGHSAWACKGLNVSQSELDASLRIQFYDGMPTSEIADAQIQTASSLISLKQPEYDQVTARFVRQKIYKQVTGGGIEYPHLRTMISQGIFFQQLDDRLADPKLFDLEALNAAIVPERDDKFAYLGIQTIADRYLLCRPLKAGEKKAIYEMPQHFWMRVAMGLAILEDNPTQRAIEFYDVMSQFDYIPSTPTLFNSGTRHAQMSSCYLSYVTDDLKQIFDLGITQTAMLSKWAGGVGTDWTEVRAAGSIIKSTNGKSNGVVPFLKIVDSTAVAVNQGGKRKGAVSPYLENWHADFLDFCDMRLQTGDDNMRTHNLHPAAWVSDLFMKRKNAGEDWSFFCPTDVPGLHDLYGEEFEKAYIAAEQAGLARKTMPAMDVWKYHLDKLQRTGYPWVTFKDACNLRNPQDHVGVVHNSNLCTEITLVNNVDEVAVCNLGSIVLGNHVRNGQIDSDKLSRTIKTATRMLDNVIDLNYYPTETAARSNFRHRPIGLGVMGYAEALLQCGIDWETHDHLQWADETFEQICYYATKSSMELAKERGAYETFPGSKWSKGILTIDTAKDQKVNVFSPMEWQLLREDVMKYGMRNSNVTALAPTATIANIAGVSECIQLPNEIAIDKENLSGRFTQITPLWKYGKPELIKTVWEVDQLWSIKANNRRQKWIDQSQSLNLYRRKEIKGRTLDLWYTEAWEGGSKTSYYLRNQGATDGVGRLEDVVAAQTVEVPDGQQDVTSYFECEACQ
jgi:ribonucleoside-diphosphate reductase alpha chain